jgi:hypothetical protein
MNFNKTENAFSPLPARTKASNADMTACLPLQDCIVQTTSIPAYGRKYLPPRWSPDNKATGLRPENSAVALDAYLRRYMGAARLQWQVLKLYGCAHRCPVAAAVYQTAYKCYAVCSHLHWQDTKLHAHGGCCPAAVTG